MYEKNFKKYKGKIFLIFILFLVLYIIVKVVEGFSKLEQSNKDDLPIGFNISSEDSNCFNKTAWRTLKVVKTLPSKVRYPVSLLTYNDKYYLIITRYTNKNIEEPIKNTILFEKQDVDRSVGLVYNILELENLNFQFKSGYVRPCSNVIFLSNTDLYSSRIINEKSIIYHLYTNKVGIKLHEEGPVDLFLEQSNESSDTKIPVEVSVIKRKNFVYFLFIINKNSQDKSMPNLIQNIINQ